MLASLAMFFKWAAFASLVFLLIGLYKPWWVLWWEDTQNRLGVIKLYLGVAFLTYLISRLLSLWN